jgi:NADH:ubiquinone oxidoreductase subunit
LLSRLFGWWDGPTIGTLFTVGRKGVLVGTDSFGNRYFEALTNKGSYDGRKRRYVLYNGYADASKIPPDWHGWMHYLYDIPPSQTPLPKKVWEKDHLPNLTGTPFASLPPGSMASEAKRNKTTADYEPWVP